MSDFSNRLPSMEGLYISCVFMRGRVVEIQKSCLGGLVDRLNVDDCEGVVVVLIWKDCTVLIQSMNEGSLLIGNSFNECMFLYVCAWTT